MHPFNNNWPVYRIGLGTVEPTCHWRPVAGKDHYASPSSHGTRGCSTFQRVRPRLEIRSGNIVECELGHQKLRFDSFLDDCSFRSANRRDWISDLNSRYVHIFIITMPNQIYTCACVTAMTAKITKKYFILCQVRETYWRMI